MRLSFIIPAFNNAEYIHPAIDSCLGQTHKDIEVVVVDDASADSTADYLAWMEKQDNGGRLKIIRNAVNMGRSASRNIGNAAATGDIIAVLDADDLATPRRAELTVAKFKAGSVFVHGAAHKMDPVGRDLGMVESDVFNRDKAIAAMSAGIVHSTVAYSKEIATRYPYLAGEPARLGVDDFTMFMAMAFDGVKFDYIPAPLAAYRINEFGISAQRDPKEVHEFKTGFLKGLQVPA